MPTVFFWWICIEMKHLKRSGEFIEREKKLRVQFLEKYRFIHYTLRKSKIGEYFLNMQPVAGAAVPPAIVVSGFHDSR